MATWMMKGSVSWRSHDPPSTSYSASTLAHSVFSTTPGTGTAGTSGSSGVELPKVALVPLVAVVALVVLPLCRGDGRNRKQSLKAV